MVLPVVDSAMPLAATIDEVCGTESSTLCAPLLMVRAPPAADMTTVPDVKVVLLAAIATPPPPPAAVVMYAGIPMLRPLVFSVATTAVPAVVADVKPVPANTDED